MFPTNTHKKKLVTFFFVVVSLFLLYLGIPPQTPASSFPNALLYASALIKSRGVRVVPCAPPLIGLSQITSGQLIRPLTGPKGREASAAAPGKSTPKRHDEFCTRNHGMWRARTLSRLYKVPRYMRRFPTGRSASRALWSVFFKTRCQDEAKTCNNPGLWPGIFQSRYGQFFPIGTK